MPADADGMAGRSWLVIFQRLRELRALMLSLLACYHFPKKKNILNQPTYMLTVSKRISMSGTSSSKTMDRMPAGSMASTEKKSEGKGALQQTMATSTESSALREQRTGLASDDSELENCFEKHIQQGTERWISSLAFR
jgi:hypothetical protein